MKRPKRVECDQCYNFISPSWMTSFDIIKLKKEEKASCKLGKRVMFRMNGSPYQPREVGWFRYCGDFKLIEL